jgi:hypothetical protein
MTETPIPEESTESATALFQEQLDALEAISLPEVEGRERLGALAFENAPRARSSAT